MDTVRDCLESQLESRHWSKDPDVFPLWDPSQLLNTSELLLLRAATLQTEYSDDDDASSVASDEYASKLVTIIIHVYSHVHMYSTV